MKVFCVILSYNNEKILQVIRSVLSQSLAPSKIIVVDNNSESFYKKKLFQMKNKKVEVIFNKNNVGVGMGYNIGIKKSLANKADAIWLLDGDAIPEKDCLNNLIEAFYQKGCYIFSPISIDPITNIPTIGTLHPLGLRKTKLIVQKSKIIEIDSCLTAGCFIPAQIFKKAGMYREDFFVDFIDHEFALRVRKHGFKIFLVPKAKIYHSIGEFEKKIKKRLHKLWRTYFMIRNSTYVTFHLHPSIFPIWAYYYFISFFLARLKRYHSFKFVKIFVQGLNDGIKGKLMNNLWWLNYE